MTVFSRRSFIAGVAAVPFVAWFEKRTLAEGPAVRYDIRSPDGQRMLRIYAEAVASMGRIPIPQPTSWAFHWYTHWVRGDSDKPTEIARNFPQPGPARQLAQDMWSTCQAHDNDDEHEQYFLPWHRMYVFFLEQIVREVTRERSFTLPYWDYTVTDAAIHGVLPAQFRQSGDPVFKSLYRPNRNKTGRGYADVNDGDPIDKYVPGALTLVALGQGAYLPYGALPGFNSLLDNDLHGNIHELVGDGTNMGNVPWAANDPVFWVHHSNIDRLWASWNKNGGVNPGGSWMDHAFVFADGTGTRVSAKVGDFTDIGVLKYTYDRFEPAPPGFSPQKGTMPDTSTLLAVVRGRVALGAKPVRGRLEPTAVGAAPPTSIAARVAALAPNRRVYLVVRGRRADVAPGVLYQVYLDLPENAASADAAAHLVGTINFFDAVKHPGHDAPASTARFVSFDITDVAKALHAKQQLTDAPTVTVVPLGDPADGANASVEEVTLVEQ